MAREWSFYRDFLPILVLLGTECNDMGLLTLFKVASLQGLNSYVFVAYAYTVATTVLLPITFFHRRSRVVPPLSFSTVSKIVLLGVIGSSSQILGYAGISYSSPALASSIGNLVPAFTFILAVMCRMEKLAAKSRSSQAKVMGSIISISGAFVLTFYKGPSIFNAHKHVSLSPQDPINFLKSEDASWATGGILLIADYILTSVWYILEEDILRVFPEELTLVLFYNVTATIFTATVGLLAVPNASAWKIGLNVSLISIVSSGLFGKLMSNVIYAWTLNLKGAVFVTSLRPLQIVIAVAMGVVFLNDTLYIGRRYCYKDLLPLVVLVANECNNTALFTLFKAATLQGMSSYVFVSYAYSLAFLVLLPITFLYRRSRVVPPLNFSILSKIALLGLIGCSSQILGYVGISYSSPTLSSAISNLTPAFTFILAVICRMEKIAIRSRTTQAKIWGSIISISGAFIVTFCKGQSIIFADNSPSIQLSQSNAILASVDRNWAFGGLLLTACNILLTIWFVFQVEILKEFPDELTMVFFYNLYAAIVASIVGLIAEKNSSAWKIRPDISLISIVCTGIFNKFLSSAIYAWGIHLKGPVYVAMFKPLSIVIAVAMGVMFLGDTLYVGSLIGGTVISIGFYTVMWGKATEQKEEEEDVGSQESPITENVPLLQTYETVNSTKKTDARV